MSSTCTIFPVREASDILVIKFLFSSYASNLAIDLTFQSFAEELDSLPGKYAPPTGELFLAVDQKASPVGCIAIRALPLAGQGCCEMKRLYVTPQGRGLGVGKALAVEAIACARELGYTEIKLDTLPEMIAAINLYKSVGFEPCERYYDNPIEDVVFLSKDLTKASE